jgi:hypothetical protein
MLSYIILFTDEYRHVITLVFLLSQFTLKFCLKNPAATRGISLGRKKLESNTQVILDALYAT